MTDATLIRAASKAKDVYSTISIQYDIVVR